MTALDSIVTDRPTQIRLDVRLQCQVFFLIENGDQVRMLCVAVQLSVSPVQVHLHQLITNRQRLYTVPVRRKHACESKMTVLSLLLTRALQPVTTRDHMSPIAISPAGTVSD